MRTLTRLALIVGGADDEHMTTLLIVLLPLAVTIAVGLLATRYGVDSRHDGPGGLRHSWR
jgi:hypothetical protein